MKRAIPFLIGLLSIVLIGAAACGGDDDAPAGERPRGTTAPVATSAPATAAPATTAPTAAPAVATQAPAATTAPASGGAASSGGDAASIERGQSVFSLAGCTPAILLKDSPEPSAYSDLNLPTFPPWAPPGVPDYRRKSTSGSPLISRPPLWWTVSHR